MYCFKCGKEIMDEAVICPNCGCPTSNFQNSNSNSTVVGNSSEYPIIKKFKEDVNSLYTISIIALVLSLGIGIIFYIIAVVKNKKLFVPDITTTVPSEIAEFEATNRKLQKARNIAGIAGAISIFLIVMTIYIALVALVSGV